MVLFFCFEVLYRFGVFWRINDLLMLKSFQTLNPTASTSSLASPQSLWCSRSSGASTCSGGIATWRRSALRSSPAARLWRRGTSTTSTEPMLEGGMERENMETEIKSMSAIQTLTMARNLKLLYKQRKFCFHCRIIIKFFSSLVENMWYVYRLFTQNTWFSSAMSIVVLFKSVFWTVPYCNRLLIESLTA